jgi:hypothetical protein
LFHTQAASVTWALFHVEHHCPSLLLGALLCPEQDHQ